MTPAERWAAVAARDPQALHRFVYAVKTTGVYCRVACRARLPLPENVMFFDTVEKAERAGFRPCKRCRPDVADFHPHCERIRKACRIIEQAQKELSLKELASRAAMSPFHFQRIFREATGLTPKQYAKAHRLNTLKKTLKGAATVTEAIYDAGFSSNSRAYDRLGERLGMSPRAYRAGGAGQRLHYGFTKTALDWMLVAATEKGVCLIAFDDHRDALLKELRERFPKAELREGDAQFTHWMKTAAKMVAHPGASGSLPLDTRGTAFQERVWQALRAIKAGTTKTYSDVAKAIGKPKAVRAVAKACGDNPVALAVPCHRVIGKDGKLHGYRWGLKRKRALLEMEAED